MDPASSELFKDGRYPSRRPTDRRGDLAFFEELAGRYPIVSIEDPLAEDDWDGWAALTARLGASAQVVGDDVFVTNPERLERGIRERVANAILVKVNQIGSLTETLDTVRLAQLAGVRRRRVAPQRRDRGHHDRRPRGGDDRRPDQDRRSLPRRAHGEVQPAAADRRGAGGGARFAGRTFMAGAPPGGGAA